MQPKVHLFISLKNQSENSTTAELLDFGLNAAAISGLTGGPILCGKYQRIHVLLYACHTTARGYETLLHYDPVRFNQNLHSVVFNCFRTLRAAPAFFISVEMVIRQVYVGGIVDFK
jgi:hypothetical protein